MGEAFEALGINLPALIASAVNFIILFLVLRMVLFRPITRMLDERRERIAEGLNAAETARAEAARSEANIQAQLQEARAQGQEIVANAQQLANRLQAEAREQGERDREEFTRRARQEIELERDRAISELRAEFADITVRAAERVIGQAVDRDAHQRIIEETLADSPLSEN